MNLGRATNFSDYERDKVPRSEESKAGFLIAGGFGGFQDERRGAHRRGTAVIYRPNACTDLLSRELTSGSRSRAPLAADERWRVSVNVGSTRCANYCHLCETMPNLPGSMTPMTSHRAGRISHGERMAIAARLLSLVDD